MAVRKNCLHFGTKSGSREAFLRTGVPHPQVRFLPPPLIDSIALVTFTLFVGGFEQGTKLCYSKRELAQEMAGLWRYLEAKYQRLTARHTNGVRSLPARA